MLMTQQQVLQIKPIMCGTQGAIFSDVSFGFFAAFKNLHDEQIHLSMDQQGKISFMHLFDHLPAEWINEWDSQGRAMSLRSGIIAGFMRNSQFYTLTELMSDIRDS